MVVPFDCACLEAATVLILSRCSAYLEAAIVGAHREVVAVQRGQYKCRQAHRFWAGPYKVDCRHWRQPAWTTRLAKPSTLATVRYAGGKNRPTQSRSHTGAFREATRVAAPQARLHHQCAVHVFHCFLYHPLAEGTWHRRGLTIVCQASTQSRPTCFLVGYLVAYARSRLFTGTTTCAGFCW